MRLEGNRTPASYSREEAVQIRARAMNPDSEIVCPRCGRLLDIGPAVRQVDRRAGSAVRLLTCDTCHRCLAVTGMPARTKRG